MLVDSLPLFLQMIKHNVILHALVTSGSFHGVEFGEIAHDIKSEAAIEFFNFPLSKEDSFKEVLFSVEEDSSESGPGRTMNIILSTDDAKYADNFSHYFDSTRTGNKNGESPVMQEVYWQRDAGVFQIYDPPVPPAFVGVVKNPVYGYGIFISFPHDFEQRIKARLQLQGSDGQNGSPPGRKKAF